MPVAEAPFCEACGETFSWAWRPRRPPPGSGHDLTHPGGIPPCRSTARARTGSTSNYPSGESGSECIVPHPTFDLFPPPRPPAPPWAGRWRRWLGGPQEHPPPSHHQYQDKNKTNHHHQVSSHKVDLRDSPSPPRGPAPDWQETRQEGWTPYPSPPPQTGPTRQHQNPRQTPEDKHPLACTTSTSKTEPEPPPNKMNPEATKETKIPPHTTQRHSPAPRSSGPRAPDGGRGCAFPSRARGIALGGGVGRHPPAHASGHLRKSAITRAGPEPCRRLVGLSACPDYPPVRASVESFFSTCWRKRAPAVTYRRMP